MVMMRSTRWPAVVVRREEVEDTSPSSLPLRKVTVNIFAKGERVVIQKDISASLHRQSPSTRSPKTGKMP